VLEHCHEGETNCQFSIFGAFPSDHTPKATADVNEQSLLTVLKKFPQSVTLLNWTSKFQELLTATTYVEI
jgi:hypothetical protein